MIEIPITTLTSLTTLSRNILHIVPHMFLPLGYLHPAANNTLIANYFVSFISMLMSLLSVAYLTIIFKTATCHLSGSWHFWISLPCITSCSTFNLLTHYKFVLPPLIKCKLDIQNYFVLHTNISQDTTPYRKHLSIFLNE